MSGSRRWTTESVFFIRFVRNIFDAHAASNLPRILVTGVSRWLGESPDVDWRPPLMLTEVSFDQHWWRWRSFHGVAVDLVAGAVHSVILDRVVVFHRVDTAVGRLLWMWSWSFDLVNVGEGFGFFKEHQQKQSSHTVLYNTVHQVDWKKKKIPVVSEEILISYYD